VVDAARSVTVWPACGDAGSTLMATCGAATAATAARASSMPAPQVLVVQ
jgi:hypothetical protein